MYQSDPMDDLEFAYYQSMFRAANDITRNFANHQLAENHFLAFNRAKEVWRIVNALWSAFNELIVYQGDK